MGWGGRRKNGRTAWQTIVGCLASRGTGAPPHLTLGSGTAECVNGAVGFLAAWVRGEEKVSENRRRNSEAEGAGKVKVAPGVTVGSLRRFRAALIGPTQGTPESASAAPIGKPESPERENTVLQVLCLWVQTQGV